MMYGSGNSGPRREVWRVGDRVRLVRTAHTGTAAHPEQTRPTTMFVWVRWDDGVDSWVDPNSLDVADVS